MTDGKTFAIIVKVVKRKFENENVLHSIGVYYQRFEIVLVKGILSCITALQIEKIHMLVSLL